MTSFTTAELITVSVANIWTIYIHVPHAIHLKMKNPSDLTLVYT